MIRLFFPCLTLLFLFSCKTKIQNSKTESRNYFNSNSYKEYLNGLKEKTHVLESEKSYLTVIGESEFINLSKGDFDVIYFYKASRDSLFHIYVIKTIYGLTTATHKIGKLNEQYFIDNDIQKFKCTLTSEKIENSSLSAVREELNKAKTQIKKTLPGDYDSPLQLILYFDGNDYYRLSALQLEQPILNILDSTIRNFKPFTTGGQ